MHLFKRGEAPFTHLMRPAGCARQRPVSGHGSGVGEAGAQALTLPTAITARTAEEGSGTAAEPVCRNVAFRSLYESFGVTITS